MVNLVIKYDLLLKKFLIKMQFKFRDIVGNILMLSITKPLNTRQWFLIVLKVNDKIY
ncbi:MAG: hypothetical protein ACJAZX_000729 [Rickettsiales bacterium]|jgi:hypothetical protein